MGADGGMAPQIQHFFSSSGSWEGGEEIYVIVLVGGGKDWQNYLEPIF